MVDVQNKHPIAQAKKDLEAAIAMLAEKHGLKVGICSHFAGEEALLSSVTLLAKEPEDFYAKCLERFPVTGLEPNISVGSELMDDAGDVYVLIGRDPDSNDNELLLLKRDEGSGEYHRAPPQWVNQLKQL